MTKHTSTPWNVADGDTFVFSPVNGSRVCECDGQELTYTEDQANAAFIVKAVNAHNDLVAALELILPLAKGYAPEGQTDAAKRTCRSWVAAAEAIIAKIEPLDNGTGSE